MKSGESSACSVILPQAPSSLELYLLSLLGAGGFPLLPQVPASASLKRRQKLSCGSHSAFLS